MTERIRHFHARRMFKQADEHVFVIVRQLLFRLTQRPHCLLIDHKLFLITLFQIVYQSHVSYPAATIELRNMETINHDLHTLAKHLCGCMHKPFIHICTYGVDRGVRAEVYH